MLGIRFRQDHGEALLPQPTDDFGEASRQDGGDTLEWFVEQEELVTWHQRTGQGHKLLLPARQLQSSTMAEFTDFRHQVVDPLQPPC